MKRTLTSLAGYAIHATDGLVGHADGFYFHDQDWRVGYMVVDLDHWFDQDRVLLPVQAVRDIDDDKQELTVDMDREAVKHAPAHDSKMPAITLPIEMRASWFSMKVLPPARRGWRTAAAPRTALSTMPSTSVRLISARSIVPGTKTMPLGQCIAM